MINYQLLLTQEHRCIFLFRVVIQIRLSQTVIKGSPDAENKLRDENQQSWDKTDAQHSFGVALFRLIRA